MMIISNVVAGYKLMLVLRLVFVVVPSPPYLVLQPFTWITSHLNNPMSHQSMAAGLVPATCGTNGARRGVIT